MMMFVRNLSFISQPAAWVAAMVVSDMKERLSPKKAPPTTIATIKGTLEPHSAARPVAIGASATMVPTDVPTAIEMKQAVRNSPA